MAAVGVSLEGNVIDAWHARGTMREVALIVNPHASEVTEARLAAVERVLRERLALCGWKGEPNDVRTADVNQLSTASP